MQHQEKEFLAAVQAIAPEARPTALKYLKEMAKRFPAQEVEPLRLVSGGENVYSLGSIRARRGRLD
jgi:hypothetical protein